MSNSLRMPMAEWFFRLSEARVPYQAWSLAMCAVLFKVTDNEQLAVLCAMDSQGTADKTYNKWKKYLSDNGWVRVTAVTVGRVTTIEVTPSIDTVPVTFTDCKPRDPDRFASGKNYGREEEITDEDDVPVVKITDETVKVTDEPRSVVEVTAETVSSVKVTDASRALIESPSEITKLKQEVNTPLPPSPPPENPLVADARSAFDAYNEVAARCGLPRAEKLTSDRQRKIIARLKDYGLDGWNRALGNIEKSAFLTGQTQLKFRADLDFVCQAKSFGKLHDGGYGNGRHAQPPPAVKAQNEVLIDEAFSKAWEADKPREPYI